MSIILQDSVHLETPFRSPVRPSAPLDPRTSPGEGDVSFELESPGGYRRTVTGKDRLSRRRGEDVHGARTRRSADPGASAGHQENDRERRVGASRYKRPERYFDEGGFDDPNDVSLPSPCFAPIIFVGRSATAWFAVTGQ